MYGEKSGLNNIGAYDDYAPLETEETDTDGLLSPFTFLCFAVILVLFGAVMLFSSSYDTALREDAAFYSTFLKQIGALVIGLVAGTSLCFLPQRILRKSYFVLFPVYSILFILALSLKSYTPSFLYTSVMGGFGTVTLIFLLSDIVPLIISHERRGVTLIGLVAAVIFILVTEALVCGSGWYLLSGIVIVSTLVSVKVKRSYIVYFSVVMLVAFTFLILTSKSLLISFTRSAFPLSDPEYYSSSLYLSQEAISEGGVIGVGIGNGLYKLGLIEDIEGEYIYASLSEETGMMGTIIIIFCLLMILVIGIRNSSRAYRKNEYFISSFMLGTVVYISFSLLLNMLYVSGLLPFEGVPLLLFSYNPINEALTAVLFCLLYKFIYRVGREKNR